MPWTLQSNPTNTSSHHFSGLVPFNPQPCACWEGSFPLEINFPPETAPQTLHLEQQRLRVGARGDIHGGERHCCSSLGGGEGEGKRDFALWLIFDPSFDF